VNLKEAQEVYTKYL